MPTEYRNATELVPVAFDGRREGCAFDGVAPGGEFQVPAIPDRSEYPIAVRLPSENFEYPHSVSHLPSA